MRTERRPMLFFVEGRILQEEVHYDQGMAVAVQTVDVTSELHKVLVVSGDPELDATDFAHPAWWRGSEYGFDQCIRAVTKVLDGKDAGGGVAREPWEGLRRRLMRLVAMAGGDVQSSNGLSVGADQHMGRTPGTDRTLEVEVMGQGGEGLGAGVRAEAPPQEG